MSVSTRPRPALLLSLALLLSVGAASAKSSALSPAQKGRIQSAYGRLPLSFEQNAGQADRQVKFLSRGPGYSFFLTPTQAVMSLQKGKAPASVLRTTMEGANPAPLVTGKDKLPGQVNYLIGRDKSKWRTHIATYGQVSYKSVYPGVDLRYYGTSRQLEYDFIVQPGASADAIKLGFDGAKNVALTKAGGLTLSTQGGAVQWRAPIVYQTLHGRKVTVPGKFVVSGKTARFTVGSYDRSKPLVIDPAVDYATFLGGANSDGIAVAVDGDGNAYVTGAATASDFPSSTSLNAGSHDNVFVLKLSKTGTSVLYTTLIGGNADSAGYGIVLDSIGFVNVVGYTAASDFPVTDGSTYAGGGDAFIAQLNPGGTGLFYSKYLKPSGSQNTGKDSANAVAIDSDDNIYVAVDTYYSSAYPGITFLGEYNDNGGALNYQYVFGTSEGKTTPAAIAYGADGNVYVTGTTTDTALYDRNNSYHGGDSDAYVAKLTSSLGYVYATYLGGSDSDSAAGIAADSSGNAYVAGTTDSSDFPETNTAFYYGYTVFVTKINAAGTSYVYSTLFETGGNGADETDDYSAGGLALDSANRVDVLINEDSSFNDDEDDPPSFGGDDYTYVFLLDTDGTNLGSEQLLHTYYDNDSGPPYAYGAGSGIVLDTTGNAYVTGSCTAGYLFTTPGTYNTTSGGAFAAKVDYFNPTPSINNINPTSAFAGSGSFTLVVTGQGFVSGVSTVYFGSTALTTTYVSPSELDATVPASAISTSGTKTVTVRNPAPGGGTSNGVSFSVVGSLSLSISPGVVYQGAPSFGKVTLHSPAGSSGVIVSLSSSNTGVASVPSSVTVASGQTSATFQISTASSVSADTPVTVTASGQGSTAKATIQVNTKYSVAGTIKKTDGTPLSGVTVTATGTGTFTLTNYTTASTTIPASGTVSVPVAVTSPGTIVDLRVGVSVAHPHVNQLKLTLIAPDGTAVVLKNTGTGGTNLLTDYPVLDTPAQSLSAFNGKQELGTWNLQVQNTGTSSGTVNLFDLNFTYQGTLTSTYKSKSDGTFAVGGLKAATYTVTPTLTGYAFSPASRTVTVGPSTTGKDFTAGTIPTLTSVSPTSAYAGDGSTTITLTGTGFVSGAVASFDGTALSTTFVSSTQLTAVVPASLLTTAGTASITVKNPSPGGTSGSVTFTVKPRLKSLSLSPTSVYSGTTVTGTVTLTGAAPLSGTVITLSSSNTGAATVPSSVTVAGGATSATFTVTTKNVTSTTTVTITASGSGATKTATLTVKPITLSDLELASATATGGSSVTATVTLSGPAPAGGTTVTPSTSNPSVATVPSSVTVTAGQTTATFPVTTKTVTTNTSVVIGAALGTVTKSKTLTVTPAASGHTSTLAPTADAYVRDGTYSSTNYGTVTTEYVQLGTASGTGDNKDTYLKFSVKGFTSVSSAKLRIYAAVSGSGSVGAVVNSDSSTGWGETTITYDNRPPQGGSVGSVTVSGTKYTIYEIDVTGYLSSFVASGKTTLGLALHGTTASSSSYIKLNSRENTTNPPQLIVTGN